MDKKDFSIEGSLKYGWDVVKGNFWFLVGVFVVAWVLVGIPHGIANNLGHSAGLAFFFRVVGWVAGTIVSIGMINIALKFLDGQKPEFNDLFSFKPHFWKYLGASVLTWLVVWAGMILLVIPGIYWAIKFQFYGYFVVEHKCEPDEAMRRSSRITKDVKWKLLWFGIVLALINVVGALCLFVGLLVTMPLTLLAFSSVYRKLLAQTPTAQATPVSPTAALGNT